METRNWTGKEKLEIVLEGMRGTVALTELCNRHQITQGMYYKWTLSSHKAQKRTFPTKGQPHFPCSFAKGLPGFSRRHARKGNCAYSLGASSLREFTRLAGPHLWALRRPCGTPLNHFLRLIWETD